MAPQAIGDAVHLGANVINLSLATPVDAPALRTAVEYALTHNVVVVAERQSPAGRRRPFYPAAYPGVLSVGAIGPDGALAAFRDRTPRSVSLRPAERDQRLPGYLPRRLRPGDNGTSFAAAFVSGVVALVRSAHPGLSAAQVVARIEATARGAAGPDRHGMVDPVRAVTVVLPAESSAGSGPGGTGGQGRPAQTARAAPSGVSAGTVALAVIAGSFGLVVVVVTAVLVIRRRQETGPSGRHAR